MKKIDLDQNLKDLENISKQLEDNTISLEESLKLFEKGINIYRTSVSELEKAKNKITILLENEEKEFDT